MWHDPIPQSLERQLVDALVRISARAGRDISRWRRLRIGDGRGGVTVRVFPDRADYGVVEESDEHRVPRGAIVRPVDSRMPFARLHRRVERPHRVLAVVFRSRESAAHPRSAA